MTYTQLKPIIHEVLKETGITALLLMGISFTVFFILYLAPGDPFQSLVSASSSSGDSEFDFLEAEPVTSNWIAVYGDWIWNVLQGNLGTSTRTGIPVAEQIGTVGFNTLLLTGGAITLTLMIALPIAVWSVLREQGAVTHSLNIFAYILSAMPVFWLGYLIVYMSANVFDYFPIYMGFSGGSLDFMQILLPIIVLGLGSGIVAEIIRFLRLNLSNVLAEEYIRTAKAKGVPVWKHAYKEGLLLPITEIIATRIPFVISGAIIVEQIFNWPGLGRMAWQAAQDRDFPVILGITLVATLLVRLGTLTQRFIYIYVNPRASHE